MPYLPSNGALEVVDSIPTGGSTIYLDKHPMSRSVILAFGYHAGCNYGSGRVIIGWPPCDCPPALARHMGHHWVKCQAEGCPSIWCDPPHTG
jgi:hypothetical protein